MSRTRPVADRMDAIGWTVTAAGCWEWNGARFPRGYGALWIGGGRTQRAHRVAYERWVGPIPAGDLVRHRCDNPPCINPAHLMTGSRRDNHHDAIARGRHTRGDLHGMRKVSSADVTCIRQRLTSGATQAELAREYDLSPSQVSNIANRRSWRAS